MAAPSLNTEDELDAQWCQVACINMSALVFTKRAFHHDDPSPSQMLC